MQKNQLIAIVLCLLIFIVGIYVQNKLFQPEKPSFWDWVRKNATPEKLTAETTAPAREGLWQWVRANAREEKPVVATKPSAPRVTVTLGDDHAFGKYVVDSLGAGIDSVTLPKFQAGDQTGRPEWLDRAKTQPKPLELIRRMEGETNSSFLLYHFPINDEAADRPRDTLGKRTWELVEPEHPEKDKSYSKAVFRTEVEGVRITKTYTFDPESYHLGLEVTLERVSPGEVTFRYQFAGGHGMPLEGAWYTSTYRNALIGGLDSNNKPKRNFQDLHSISVRSGGEAVKDADMKIRYAGVATQYFASVIAVDNLQDKENLDFIRSVRPTVEVSSLKGKITEVDIKANTFVVKVSDQEEHTFDLPPNAVELPQFARVAAGREVGVVFRPNSEDRNIAVAILDPDTTNPLFVDDITVRVDTVPLKLEPGKPVTHKYLLYNGPVKVRLLSHLDGDAAVNDVYVDRYLNDLHLNTLTDYHFPNWFGENVSSRIGLTYVLISTTNAMHAVLTFLHRWVPGGSYGLCIVLLTIMVRAVMFPLSRKQALMSVRMQELQPELAKLKEKYKEDRQAMGMAQMELFRKHKVSPLGTCWVAFLQMPIFLGLYYALQESIHFRLAPFLWIQNLAAPDMLFYWSQSIPFISQPQYHGALWYLGPYFNVLPGIAVALMMTQQSLMTPPATDETQVMQQKMMKYMMIFIGVMFYKVAAGLCIYFITSSAWGFAERKLLPKRKKEGGAPAAESKPAFFERMIGRLRPDGAAAAGARADRSAALATETGSRTKRRAARRRRDQTNEDGTWQKLKDWWADVLKQASKR